MSTFNIPHGNNESVYGPNIAPFKKDEIDLLDLFRILLNSKKFIIAIVVAFAAAGFFISLLLPQKWTSRAEITPAEKIQWSELNQAINTLDTLGVKAPVTAEQVFNLFLKNFNSQTLQEKFLGSSPLVADFPQLKNAEPEARHRGIVQLAQQLNAVNNLTDKNSQSMPYPSWTLSFTAPNAQDAQQVLNRYINYVSELVVKETVDTLRDEVALRTNFEKDSLEIERVEMLNKHDASIHRLNYSLIVANAAGIKRPVYSNGQIVQDDPDYSIALGSDGIAEKLKIENSIKDVTRLDPAFLNREYRLSQLQKINLKDIDFKPFKYQLSPSLPLKKDGLAKSQLMIMMAILGGVIACAVVLVRSAFQHHDIVSKQEHEAVKSVPAVAGTAERLFGKEQFKE
ncbi:LPS O-antigen length regulator Wzz(fepE) [Kosakonia sp. BK9b]|uniref:LPS O-antigen length regulator Wzz(fepE) n=1 Tax=Kosakonia sp. TaxID=1916651 RepID=UPI0028A2C55A|nr:LPS O-antigen length regulator Wzz(fepE) [Kosakonia sp.]